MTAFVGLGLLLGHVVIGSTATRISFDEAAR
jgi:hypothetical protein